MFFRLPVFVLFIGLSCWSLAGPETGAEETLGSHPQRIDNEFLPNLVQVHPKVLSGGLPADAAAFRELVRRSVKVVVSVDGAKPDVDSARDYGLRYIHLPIGYGGIHPRRVSELAKVLNEQDGVIYIHCHHGKHRAAAAAAVACIATGRIDGEQAMKVLDVAGTDKVYQGLFRVVGQTKRIPDSELAALVVDYREIAEVPPLAEAMSNIEQTFTRVKRLASQHRSPSTAESRREARQDVRLLRQQLAELSRTQDLSDQLPGFQKSLTRSTDSVEELERMLLDGEQDDGKAAPASSLVRQIQKVFESCIDCHARHRDQVIDGPASRLNR